MNYKKIFKVVGVVAVAAIFSIGCVEKPDDSDSTGTDGNKIEKPDDGNSSNSLVLGANEAWTNDDGEGYIFRANNEVVSIWEENGFWYYYEGCVTQFSCGKGTWSASGNNLTITYDNYAQTGTYTISDNKLMITSEWIIRSTDTSITTRKGTKTFIKTNGIVIEKGIDIEPTNLGTINVYVRDGGGSDTILTGATVTLLNGSAPKTVEHGKGVTYTNLAVGQYAVRVYKNGYTGYFNDNVTITNDVDSSSQFFISRTQTVDAILYPLTAKLVGTMYKENSIGMSAPAVGATVVLTLNDQYIERRAYDTQTDAKGVFEFDSLPAVGTAYTLTALAFQDDGGVMFQESELAADKLPPLIPNASAHLGVGVAFQIFEKKD